jgi:hypothetical protein
VEQSDPRLGWVLGLDPGTDDLNCSNFWRRSLYKVSQKFNLNFLKHYQK